MKQREAAFLEGMQSLTAPKRVGRPRKGGPRMARDMTVATGVVESGIICGDSIEVLNGMEAGWADLAFADPPFNIGYLYHGYKDTKDDGDYLDFSRKWMGAVKRALKPTGSFYLAIGDDYAADLCVIARRELGLVLRNWIVWHYTFGQATQRKFAKSHTHILYFTKDEKDFTFNADAVRVASARQTTYADARANPKGKLPDDTWVLRPQLAPETFGPETDTWFVSRLCGTFKEREGWHGCQMPLDVLTRIISVSSNAGDVVLDPFNGSGTTTVAAAVLGRKYFGIDQSEEYVKFAEERLAHSMKARTLAGAVDGERKSRVATRTDSLGRARVMKGNKSRVGKIVGIA